MIEVIEVISKHFANFVIHNLENNDIYEHGGAFVHNGTRNGTKVVVIENSNNLTWKIGTSQDVYAWLLLEYLEHMDGELITSKDSTV